MSCKIPPERRLSSAPGWEATDPTAAIPYARHGRALDWGPGIVTEWCRRAASVLWPPREPPPPWVSRRPG